MYILGFRLVSRLLASTLAYHFHCCFVRHWPLCACILNMQTFWGAAHFLRTDRMFFWWCNFSKLPKTGACSECEHSLLTQKDVWVNGTRWVIYSPEHTHGLVTMPCAYAVCLSWITWPGRLTCGSVPDSFPRSHTIPHFSAALKYQLRVPFEFNTAFWFQVQIFVLTSSLWFLWTASGSLGFECSQHFESGFHVSQSSRC